MDLLARARALAATRVLAEVSPPALVALAARVRVHALAPGAAASTRRDGSDAVLVVARGEVRLGDAVRGAGSLLGLDGALTGADPLGLVGVSDAVLLEIAVDDFLDVLAEHAVATTALAQLLAARVRGADA
ncbi:MAG: hypothetical protein IPL61_08865 [Myxococcales bacterium]|nr:hypothetical protein [Myxococcales bacterium]